MAQAPRWPEFILQATELRPSPQHRTRHGQRHWEPPETRGHNLPYSYYNSAQPATHYAFTSGQMFTCDGTRFQTSQDFNPRALASPRTYSVYYNHRRIWVLPYNAVENPVGPGHPRYEEYSPPRRVSQGHEQGSPAEKWVGWHEMKFRHEGPPMFTSFASHDGDQSRLRCKHESQYEWYSRLLPGPYREQVPLSATALHGGMNGPLPLIMALIILAAHPCQAASLLLGLFQDGRWQLGRIPVTEQTAHPGWIDQRGLMITVWPWPDRSSAMDIEAFEQGRLGKIFA